jgi:hypothetical protein
MLSPKGTEAYNAVCFKALATFLERIEVTSITFRSDERVTGVPKLCGGVHQYELITDCDSLRSKLLGRLGIIWGVVSIIFLLDFKVDLRCHIVTV